MPKSSKNREKAPRNRTITLTRSEIKGLRSSLMKINELASNKAPIDRVINGDSATALPEIEKGTFDLLFADPPYNLTKKFGESTFKRGTSEAYEEWLDSWLRLCIPLLKPSASVYICGDWRSGSAIERVGSKYFKLQNRITWEREKGRGAKRNWKNAAEDVWFFTVSNEFTFNLDAVKQRRRVLAPYRENGQPKDWDSEGNFRDTHPSNLWTDITVPFWSMSENTDHPTQKPEKLLAKIILASTNPADLILDPFAGVGTTAVVAKKLGRRFVAVESNEEYCLLAVKRLQMAENDASIQGMSDGVFWERNSKASQK